MEKLFLTIVTPTFNRRSELEVCYKSLISQSYKNFEWIIVDDGSIDDTNILVQNWIKEEKIDIVYLTQENQGRYIALNKGIKQAKGFLSMFMDSDDWFVENSIQTVYDFWNSLSSLEQNSLAGFAGLCLDENNEIIGDKFPEKNYISDFFNIRVLENIKGDKKELIKTDILKKHLFPEFKGQKRMPTSYILYGLSKEFKAIFTNIPIIYKQYLADGWSKNIDRIKMKNSITSMEYYKYVINLYYPFNKKKALVFYSNYFRYSFHNKIKIFQAIKNIKFSIILPISVFIGLIYYLKDKRKNKDIIG